jgi:hypothetical protein
MFYKNFLMKLLLENTQSAEQQLRVFMENRLLPGTSMFFAF